MTGGRSPAVEKQRAMAVRTMMSRELREESRRPRIYWLRLGVGAACLMVLAFTILWAQSRLVADSQLGLMLFGNLQTMVFCLIWLVVPFLTADTISRERREGTLGLLFLTPLRPREIVAGKAMVHWLRAVTSIGAVAPMLAVPWLLGGVGAVEYASALLIDTTSICLALSAGLTASLFARRWGEAMALAAIFASATLGAYLFFYSGQLAALASVGRGFSPLYAPHWQLSERLMVGLTMLTGVMGVWGTFAGWLPPVSHLWLDAQLATVALLVFLLVPRLAAYRLQSLIREERQPGRWEAWVKALYRPRYAQRRFRRKLSQALNRNPVGWLQQHRTGARMTKWIWCLLVVVVESAMLGSAGWDAVPSVQLWLAAFLALGVSMSASGSFAEERENGAFELLLVTPLREWDLIWGRLRGLWAQFLPAFLMLLAVSLWWRASGPAVHAWWRSWEQSLAEAVPWLLVALYLSLPAIGLWSSLVRRGFLSAWSTTVVWGLAIPLLLAFTSFGLPPTGLSRFESNNLSRFLMAFGSTQLTAAVVTLLLLHDRLTRRDFGLKSTG